LPFAFSFEPFALSLLYLALVIPTELHSSDEESLQLSFLRRQESINKIATSLASLGTLKKVVLPFV